MSAPSWADLEAFFHEALEREPGERASFLAERCAGRPELQAEVEALLRAHETTASSLEVPPVAPQTRLKAGVRLGPYEVLAELGAGGMGEVYRARDTKLGRDVAIKVLPALFLSDPERRARFEREARLLAALNHPHIGAIYGFEQAEGTLALVLELVEGPTLADRIAQGPLPLDAALPIAQQIAEALEAAHEKGIIHRDLKPANIKVTSDGTVKVLDFGLAKVCARDMGAVDLSQSPTVTATVTREGVLLGTAAFMSPEQARGQAVDKRTDIWAFGCVLYEMLTGTRAFDGEDMTEVLGAVIRLEPNWEALSSDVPQPVRTLLHSCLVKDRRHRVADISIALFVLEKAASLAATPGPQDPAYILKDVASAQAVAEVRHVLARSTRRRVAMASAAAVIAGAVLAGALVWVAMRPAPVRVSRFTINGIDPGLAITPDGSRLIYLGNNGTQLFVRALDALEPVVVFTGLLREPFVSPDGEWIGFVDTANLLKKVAVTGGPAITLAMLDTSGFRGATWAPDDTIVVATSNPATGLQRVAAAGGPTTVLTRPDRTQGEADHLWPEMLPGGRAVLFTVTAQTGGLDAAQVVVLDLQTGTRKVLVRGGSDAHYVASGHLVYARAGTLWAVAFDAATLETRGTPVPVIPDVVTTADGGVDAVVANDGTLAYVSGGGTAGVVQRTLVWVDRQGHETPIPAPPHDYVFPRLSPDGTRVAVFANAQEQGVQGDIWVWDLGRTTLTPVTFDPGLDIHPAWTPDGGRLIFSSERAGARNLFWQAADGTGAVERLTESPNQQNATAVSPDGRRLIFTEIAPKTSDDVMQLELEGTRRVTPLVQSPFIERNGIVSPDGRWLAYEANDSGQFEIYVRPFPDVNSGHWRVSTGGGTRPLWSRSGQELVYVSPAGALMRVGVERAPSWAATTPTMLVKDGYRTIPRIFLARTYDISPDGQRFLMIKEGGGADQTAAPASLIVVQNWLEELKRLVPTK